MGSSQPERRENPTQHQQGRGRRSLLPQLHSPHLPSPACQLQLGSLRGGSSLVSETCCGFAESHVSPLAGCPRKSGQLTKRLVAEGFPLVLAQLGSHRKRGCQNSLSLAYRWQPRCGSGARERGDSFLPAPPWLGGSHLLSGAGLAGRMRMESHRAKVPKTDRSLLLSSWPPDTARSHPGEGVGSRAAGHVPAPPCESSLSIRLSVSRPALPPRPWLGAAWIQH